MIPHEDFPVVLLYFFFLKYLLHIKCYFCVLPTLFFFFLKTSDVSKRSVCFEKNARLKFMVSLQSIIWVFLLNNFSRVINLLLTKLAWDRPGRISALGFFYTDLAALGPYCQDLGPIFSQYGPRAWLIRFSKFSAPTIAFLAF